ncbi:DUF3899 domain-containing protein [Sedimentibacter sp. zth1]|uniref:DUF3899 domain-containing protein n=1 Tax=Sedimentibacter sp. zth1 TaxID=2816908 RepID=UPI001A93556D|nr:DUF3899 domain-containing protein [Sedimentibacter sp. zth1]QSX06849.1 DUF3899 domain-containing protein [Sedimentibacter sp. zth1]
MNKKYIKYFITILFGVLVSFSVFNTRGLFQATSKAEIYMDLSDGFLLPGILILGFGLLLFVANCGVFDPLSYAFGSFKQAIKKKDKKDPLYPKTYFDYKQKYVDVKVPFLSLIIIGGVFLLLSFLFNYLFYLV